jgi:hypothetical protein
VAFYGELSIVASKKISLRAEEDWWYRHYIPVFLTRKKPIYLRDFLEYIGHINIKTFKLVENVCCSEVKVSFVRLSQGRFATQGGGYLRNYYSVLTEYGVTSDCNRRLKITYTIEHKL